MQEVAAFRRSLQHTRKLVDRFAFGRQSDERRCYLRIGGD